MIDGCVTLNLLKHLLILMLLCAAHAQPGVPDLTKYVNPFIGTGQGAPDYGMGNAAGNTPPGAAFPFGMVLWSPDTTTQSGGYRYEHTAINGFSLTHFSGRGISCWQDIPFLPVPGAVSASPAATFSHANENASPGSYAVNLDNGVGVELTVTQRTGFARFSFPSPNGTILVNSGGSANGNWGANWIKVNGDRQVYGAVTSGNCGGSFSYTVYFVALFDQTFVDYGDAPQSGVHLTFDTSANSTVRVRVGLSFVSFTNAYTNMTSEVTGWDFDAVRERAKAAWNRRLNSIRAEGADDDRMSVFYTALYHASIHPSTFSDANGDYLGFDGRIHRTDRIQYHNIPAWDFYRSLAPLLAITAPDVASDLAQSLVNDAQQDPGGGLPRWVHAATDSCGMFGDGGTKIIATAYAFGATNFDTQAALTAMIRGATRTDTTAAGCPVREGLADYLALGYVSTATWGSVARTLEYATSDFSIAEFAGALGDTANYRYLLKRAQNWRNLMNGNYIVPRRPDGTFVQDVGPDGCVSDGFIEGSEGQYGFMVRFNAQGLFSAMGSRAAALARLDRHFQQLNAGPCSEFAFMGNEVSLKTPWMYAFAGAPWKTQEVVRRTLAELYSNTPGGMPGNDDGGVLSAWYVLSAIGLYPQISGVGGLVVSSPVFPHVSIALPNGASLGISAPAASVENRYVQNLKINAQDYISPWVPWSVLSNGATLEFVLAGTPNLSWGVQTNAAPPSFDIPNLD
uniref:Putative alpha-1,2-mannosidase n=1 Tax=Solibacter usitatus (strain Ellin6076) TaxID=234267 RepID=Q023I7_SOLUE